MDVMRGAIFRKMYRARLRGEKGLAFLIDPDKAGGPLGLLSRMRAPANFYVLAGGSLVGAGQTSQTIAEIKRASKAPLLLFPGGPEQIVSGADAVLFLSLVSGRNPELLIGNQLRGAPIVERMGCEVIPTAYLLIDGGKPTSVSYLSGTTPLPADKPELARYTALAARYLGMRLTYLEAGSGALYSVSKDVVAAVRSAVRGPLWVGGGVRTSETVRALWNAGADVVVVGSLAEKDPHAFLRLCQDLA